MKDKHPLKGELIKPHDHRWELLTKQQKEDAIKVNCFRKENLALVRCKRCRCYQYTT